MSERLDKLCFLPPPAGAQWSGRSSESSCCEIKRDDGQTVEIDVPLFWHNPPWHLLSAETADLIAVSIGQLGVLVSALRSDLSGADGEPDFYSDEPEQDEDGSSESRSTPLPRIVPYRPQRYGISDQDFDGPRIIDVRLTMNRDESGRFAFSPEQIERWESTPASEPLAGGGWVPAATFPFDVVSMQHLASKLSQLRVLSPAAAVFVSIGPYRLDEELPEVVAAKPDGLILQLQELELDGLQLAKITRHTRQLMDNAGSADLPLWIVPGEITPDDAVKLVALGASAVAIDQWCVELVEEAENPSQSSESSGYSMRNRNNDAELVQWVEEELAARVSRFQGLLNSIQGLPLTQCLGSVNETWARDLGVPALSLSCIFTSDSASGAKPAKSRK